MARTSEVGVPAVAAARRTASTSDATLTALPHFQRQVLAEIYYRDQSVAETACNLPCSGMTAPGGTTPRRTQKSPCASSGEVRSSTVGPNKSKTAFRVPSAMR